MLICFSCNAKEEKDHKELSFDIVSNQEVEYTLLKNETKTLQNEILVIKDFQKIGIPLSVITFKESEKSYLNINNDYINVEFEYSIDENNSINTDKILLFKKDKEYIILIPSYTEEFTTYQMISYSEKEKFKDLGFKTFGYSEFEKLKSNSINKFTFHLKDDKGSPKLYAKYNSIIVNFSKSYKNDDDVNKTLTEVEKHNILQLMDKNVFNAKYVNFNGNFSICIDKESDNSIKSVSCYEISIIDNKAIVDANSFLCKGEYQIYFIKNNEIKLQSNKGTDCFFYIKKEKDSYFIKKENSFDWLLLKKK